VGDHGLGIEALDFVQVEPQLFDAGMSALISRNFPALPVMK
jgi:hypothetical protein